MLKINLDDTIVAVATPVGEGGIGIVRLSGKDALSIADKLFVSKDGRKASLYETYTAHYGRVVDKDGAKIDEAILTIMKAPKSYTKQDVIEINCHGGMIPLRRALDAALNLGARLAEPGEFTMRAFLNGRIDLAQAEAVLDIVKAKTDKSLDAALSQLEGGLSRQIKEIKAKIIDMKAHLEAAIDFPDEEIPTASPDSLAKQLNSVKEELEGLIRSSEAGRIVREGINCVICGKPNAGKSSLMNALLKEERVIVTPVPGTTRDAVSEWVSINGLAVNIVDTAGIIKTEDPLEKEGMIRSKLYLNKADLVLFVADLATGITAQDKEVISLIKDKETICALNKSDMEPRGRISPSDLKEYFGREVPSAEISALKKMNLDSLCRLISEKIWSGGVSANDYNAFINTRHKDSLMKALVSIREALDLSAAMKPQELVCVSLGEAASSLGEVMGEDVSEEVLQRIFSRFCVGK